LGSYTRALLVSQDRRHLFVTPEERHLSTYVTESYIIRIIRVRTMIVTRGESSLEKV
jgi:hypothetical protein